jgi:tRNA (cmo5U34)-methyltransferase
MNLMQPFNDPTAVGRYASDTPRRVPGFSDLHRMAMLLLRESAPETAEILVLGAGGGLELKALAESQPRWQLLGVDPSAEMLALASRIVGPLRSRIELQQGRIDQVRPGPFDGATCLLTLHFLERDERLRTLQALRKRLKPSARLVVVHHSAPNAGSVERWLARSVAFASESADVGLASAAAMTMAERLPILSAEEDAAMLHDAGFTDVAMFYAAFSFRGWVATA